LRKGNQHFELAVKRKLPPFHPVLSMLSYS